MTHLIPTLLSLSVIFSTSCRWGDLETFDSRFKGEGVRPAFARLLNPPAPQAQAITWRKGGGLGDADLTLGADGTVTFTDRDHLAYVMSEQVFSGNFILEYEVPNLAGFQCASQVGIMLAAKDFPPGNHAESAYFWHNGRGENNALFNWTQSTGWAEVPISTGDRISIHHENGTVKLYKNFAPGVAPLEIRTVPIFQTSQLKAFAKFSPDGHHKSEQLLRPRLTLN